MQKKRLHCDKKNWLLLDEQTSPIKEKVHDLRSFRTGVLLDQQVKLLWPVAELELVDQMQHYLGQKDWSQAFITTWLNYCNGLYLGLPLKTIQKLLLAQMHSLHSFGLLISPNNK